MTENTRIVVIGGGYAGVLAANRLRQRADVDITLVNPRPHFVERIRLHQLVAGSNDATESYDELLGTGIRLVVDGANRIDAAARVVELASGATVNYDYLIYAVGSTGSVPAGVPGAAEFAYPLSELEQAVRLRARLADTPLSAPVVVVGGGLTGIEAAAEFAETGRSVSLVGTTLAPSLAASGRRSVAKRLAKLAVTVIDGAQATVTAVHADAVELAGGRRLPSAVTVWTAGFGVPGLAAASGLRTDALGRLLTDETLTSIDDDRIIAAGDAGSPSGLPLRMSCQAALPLGAQAAQTALARIEGSTPAAISQAFVGQCISVGRGAGTIQLAHTDDRPWRAYIGGKTAAFVKEQVCRGTVNYLRKEARKPGSYFWLKSGWRSAELAEQPQVIEAR
jgi:NADH dehydrogenase FAD-containing subunit